MCRRKALSKLLVIIIFWLVSLTEEASNQLLSLSSLTFPCTVFMLKDPSSVSACLRTTASQSLTIRHWANHVVVVIQDVAAIPTTTMMMDLTYYKDEWQMIKSSPLIRVLFVMWFERFLLSPAASSSSLTEFGTIISIHLASFAKHDTRVH